LTVKTQLVYVGFLFVCQSDYMLRCDYMLGPKHVATLTNK